MRKISLLVAVVMLLASVACGPSASPAESIPAPVTTSEPPTQPPATAESPAAVPPTATPEPPTPPATDTPVPPTGPAEVNVQVYFTDEKRFNAGTLPFEVAVERLVPASADLPGAVLQEFFKGPTEEEQARGLRAITSGFTGFSALEVKDGIARVYLTGPCVSHGAAYNVAALIMRNLSQFEEIRAVKIYDAEGVTEEPEGEVNSIPPCLEP
ncbi:MAG: GerMN domain-containing protein [Anaerolineae bacterium]|nr:GerMN domain-containing protein [Anaerolineae bacterium]